VKYHIQVAIQLRYYDEWMIRSYYFLTTCTSYAITRVLEFFTEGKVM